MISIYGPDDIKAFCRQLYGDKRLLITPQVYTDYIGSLEASESFNGNIQIQQNADFILLGYGLDVEGDWTVGGKILFSDSGSGEQFMNRPAFFDCAMTTGLANFQKTLHWPRYIGGNSSVTYAGVSGAGAMNRVSVCLHGFMVRQYL